MEFDLISAESSSTSKSHSKIDVSDSWSVLDEGVFLSQLFRRASMLNSYFQKAVFDTVFTQMVDPNANVELNQPDYIESFFRDSDLYDTECILAEVRNCPENKDVEEKPSKLVGAGAKASNEFKFQRSMSSGNASDLYKTAQIKFDKFDIFDKQNICTEATTPSFNNNLTGNNSVSKASFGIFTRARSADHAGPVANFQFSSPLNRMDAPQTDPENHPHVKSFQQSHAAKINKVSITDFIKRLTLGFGGIESQHRENEPKDDINEGDSSDSRRVMICHFEEGPGFVAIHSAPVKAINRMREKILDYSQQGNLWAGWPLTANILDPVRASIVCNGPSQILQVMY
jgi:hypothetical protein